MPDENNPQAVVDETNTQQQEHAGPEVDSARNDDDLDALLQEFERPSPQYQVQQPEYRPQQAQQPDQTAAIAEQVRQLQGQIASRQYRDDITEAVKVVKGNLGLNDGIIEGWMHHKALSDPRVAEAWQRRAEQPAQFAKILRGLHKELAQEFSKQPDKQVTEDRDAVAAAVRGASTKAPEEKPPDFSRMNNQEGRKAVMEKFGFDPGW